MIDIHCHIIPGLDDGSDSIEESIKMARIAYENGTDIIVATPHCNRPDSYENHWSRSFYNKFVGLKEAMGKSGLPVKLICGQEVFCTKRILQLIKEDKIVPINNSRYILIEFDFYEYSSVAYQYISELVSQGYVPIVAHPERYEFVAQEADAAVKMKNIGALLQINKGSITGGFGQRAKREAFKMLDERLVDFVASDAHSPYMRTPNMSDAHEMISEIYSLDYANMIFEENPRLVIVDKKINSY